MSKIKTSQKNGAKPLEPDPRLSKESNIQTANESAISQLFEFLKDRPVYVNSIAAGLLGLDHGSVLREMQNARAEMVRFYVEKQAGRLSSQEASVQIERFLDDVDEIVSRLLSQPADMASWFEIENLYTQSPSLAKTVWEWIKREARLEFESGHRAAKVFEPVHWLREAWRRAQYLAIRESFIEQWKPQGGIELAMIDMLTQSFYLYMYWTEVAVTRTETEVRSESGSVAEATYPEQQNSGQHKSGHWTLPYVHEQEAIEHAAQMSDRYQRAFQRTLRSMRDLRRYSTPVTINNPQQVNIASDGGKQVNYADSK